MRTPGILASTLAIAMAAAGIEATALAAPAKKPAPVSKAQLAKALPKNLWAVLNPKLVKSKWITAKVMAKGYLSTLQQKAAAKHSRFSKFALDALDALNKGFDTMGACWANLRIALARLIGGAVKGAGQPISNAMKPVLAAVEKAASTKDAKLAGVAKALGAAAKALKKGSPYRKAIFGAGVWLRKRCNLYKVTGGDEKPAAKKKAGKK